MTHNYKTVIIFVVFIAIFVGGMLNASDLKIALNIISSDQSADEAFLSQFEESLKKDINDIEKYSIIPRSKLLDIVSWTNIDLNDCERLSCITEVGRIVEANYIIAGFVKKRSKFSIDIYIVNVSKGTSIASNSFDESERSLKKGGMKKIAQMIVRALEKTAPKVNVEISSTPAGAVVSLNNDALGETPISVPNLRKRQKYSLLFKKDGYETQHLEFTLGNQKRIHTKLIPMKGSVQISGFPSKAKVYINNKYAGKFPQIDYQNILGSYSIKIEKPGYKKHRDVFEITNDASRKLQFHLKPKPKLPAMILSSVVPGTGQISRGFTWRGLFFMAAAAGVGYLTALEYIDYDNKHNQYINDLNQYETQSDLNKIKSDKERVFSSFDAMKTQETMLNNYLYAAGAVWSINILEIVFE